MKKFTIIFLFVLTAGCDQFEPDQLSDCANSPCTASDTSSNSESSNNESDSNVDDNNVSDIGEQLAQFNSPVSTKNYLQINNSYSSMTGIETNHPEILAEYDAIIMQLPATANPEALNGFNLIAQTRLAFAYCHEYLNQNYELYQDLSDDRAIRLFLDNMIDVDIENNPAHLELYQSLIEIMNDSDSLLEETDEPEKRRKLFDISCSALLASSYITLL